MYQKKSKRRKSRNKVKSKVKSKVKRSKVKSKAKRSKSNRRQFRKSSHTTRRAGVYVHTLDRGISLIPEDNIPLSIAQHLQSDYFVRGHNNIDILNINEYNYIHYLYSTAGLQLIRPSFLVQDLEEYARNPDFNSKYFIGVQYKEVGDIQLCLTGTKNKILDIVDGEYDRNDTLTREVLEESGLNINFNRLNSLIYYSTINYQKWQIIFADIADIILRDFDLPKLATSNYYNATTNKQQKRVNDDGTYKSAAFIFGNKEIFRDIYQVIYQNSAFTDALRTSLNHDKIDKICLIKGSVFLKVYQEYLQPTYPRYQDKYQLIKFY